MMNVHPLALLIVLFLPGILVSGCATTGGPQSGSEEGVSTKIDFAPRFNVEKAVIGVFSGNGLEFTDRTTNRLTFRGAGRPAAQERFGQWFGEGVEAMVQVTITTTEYRTHVVRCDVYQSRSGPAGPWQRVTEGTAAFKRLLKDVKKLASLM